MQLDGRLSLVPIRRIEDLKDSVHGANLEAIQMAKSAGW